MSETGFGGNAGQSDFQARLSRLGHGQEAPPLPADMHVRVPRPKGPVKLNDWRENIRYPLAFVGAFFIGVLAVCVAKYVSFHIAYDPTPPNEAEMPSPADAMMYLDLGMALAVSFVLKNAFRLDGKEWAIAQTAGIVGMSAIFHNFVHMWPEVFSGLFSPEWVEFEMWLNAYGTISFLGYVVPL